MAFAEIVARFASLNKRDNIEPRTNKEGKRKVGDAREDEVTTKFDKANNPAEVAAIGSTYGIPDAVLLEKAKSAPNFGQFLMTVKNLCRGVLSRKAKVESITGKAPKFEQVGTKKLTQEHLAEYRKANRPAKAEKAPAAAKPAKKAAAKGKAVEAAAAPKGAPSKKEAASRGRGGKRKAAAAAAASAAEGGDAGGVEQPGEDPVGVGEPANA